MALKFNSNGLVDCEYYRDKDYNSYLNYLEKDGVTATPLSKEEYRKRYVMR